MMKKYLLLGVLGCGLALAACNRDEEEAHPTYADKNWYQVADKPGELNQLLYKIYVDTGMPIFVNDTLGEENYATDAAGNPVYRVEDLNLSYALFGSVDSQVSDSIRNEYVVLCKDEAAMIKAAELIRDKVIPNLPKNLEARPKCYLIVDSLNITLRCTAGNIFTGYTTYQKNASDHVYVALKGTAAGDLCDILDMTPEEQEIWAGRIVAAEAASWISTNLVNAESEFVTITNEGKGLFDPAYYSQSNYTVGVGVFDLATYPTQYNMDTEVVAGMFGFYTEFEDLQIRVMYTMEQDVLEYAARVYAYKGREDEFLSKYDPASKVYRKFKVMQEYVAMYEENLEL